MYLEYSEYTSYGGTLDEATFNKIEYEAEAYVNWYTFNRLKIEETYPEAVKKCMYAIIDLINNKMNTLNAGSGEGSGAGTGAIASQSNDGVSVSYNVLSAKELIDSSDKELKDIIQRYLQGVRNNLGYRLLFRGIYPGEVVQ